MEVTMSQAGVLKNIIIPLQDWFCKEIPFNKEKVYVEVLSFYSDDILRSAMSQLKKEWIQQGMPQPASIDKICIELSDTNGMENSSVCNCGKHKGIGLWTHFRRAQVYAW